MRNKSPWVGHWWWCNTNNSVAVVKQDGSLLNPTSYERNKAETTWIFLKGTLRSDKEVDFYEPGLRIRVSTVSIKDIPFPPVEYLDEGTHEFELTENSYILYD